MLLLIIDNRYCVSVARGLLKHRAPGEPREVVKNVERINDDWQHVSFDETGERYTTYARESLMNQRRRSSALALEGLIRRRAGCWRYARCRAGRPQPPEQPRSLR